MKIVSLKQNHDGTVAYIDDGKLVFSIEQEKQSGSRNSSLNFPTFVRALSEWKINPDAIALSGWIEHYYGLESPLVDMTLSLQDDLRLFLSSHERSHVMGAYGMSPFPQGQPCYCLTYEGGFGTFYRIDENVRIQTLKKVMTKPGERYACPYLIGNQYREKPPAGTPIDQVMNFKLVNWFFSSVPHHLAGKVMALASYGDDLPPNEEERSFIDAMLDFEMDEIGMMLGDARKKAEAPGSDFDVEAWFDRELRPRPDLRAVVAAMIPYVGVGVESPRFCNLVKKLSDGIFDRFYQYARENLTEGLPLLISGGCGLNCEWNSRWKDCGLFADVFVPPCPNDAGSAIGTAIDAQFHYTGNAKIEWDVYAGEEFVVDIGGSDLDLEFYIYEKTHARVAELLRDGKILGWISGKWEIGPRALGNRSILAAPFTKETQNRLNKIKQREGYRPVAPICMEEHAAEYFHINYSSPYMLHFHQVKTDKLQAVTHVDGSARAQTVNAQQNADMHALLSAFRDITGFGVLCNTSLNFSHRGFINTLSSLRDYTLAHGLDGMVANGKIYLRKRPPHN